ncbi:MAG: DUF790 family protein [Kofleriaceae bacterium]|nr:DUF790 family protein [Kofleriaceae bacterium]
MIREQPRLYGQDDLPWIASIVDHVVATRGEPWRVLRERLEHGPISGPRVAAILGALRRLTGGRAARTAIARRVRAAVLGHPALDAAARTTRLDEVASTMGMERDELASLLWVDLADERPVTLPDGRPAEHLLAAYANLERIQRLVRRARTLRLRIWGDAIPLVRAVARYGLIASITVDGEATLLDVLGPLSLFHATTVYGRALAQLVPLLVETDRFQLELTWDIGLGPTQLHIASPILLPRLPITRRTPSPGARLARGLPKATIDPPPIEHGAHRLFPDLIVEHAGRSVYVELVGFATTDYLKAKLAAYHAAGITDVVLCIDDARAEPKQGNEPRELLRYSQRLTADALLGHIEGVTSHP